MSLDFEYTPCNLCGQQPFEIYVKRKDLNLFIDGDFQLVRCTNCGLIYQNPRPASSSIQKIYPDHYDQFNTSYTENPSLINRIDRGYGYRKRVKSITNYMKSGKLLDIGCATGDFLKTMQEAPGWNLYGVEPNIYASDYARTKLGLQVKTGVLEDEDYDNEFFNVITMWNVIEHLTDPLNTLKLIHKLLKPDGILVFNTPILDSLDAKIYGQYWIGFELPRHYYVFSRQTLIYMLKKAGFRILESRCIYGSHAASMSSLRFWLRDRSMAPAIRNLLETIIFSRVVRLITFPYFLVTDRLGLSTAPTYFCCKT